MNELDPINLKCPTLLDLASYLDGRMTDSQIAPMERHLADCPACMAAVREFREMQAHGDPAMTFVPPQVLAGAMALVKDVPAIRGGHRLVLTHNAAALAASIIIGVGGYVIGAYMDVIEQAAARNERADFSFGLLETPASDQTASDWMSLTLPEASS